MDKQKQSKYQKEISKIEYLYQRINTQYEDCFWRYSHDEEWVQKHINRAYIFEACRNLYEIARGHEWFFDKETRDFDLAYLKKLYNQKDEIRFLEEYGNFAWEYLMKNFSLYKILNEKDLKGIGKLKWWDKVRYLRIKRNIEKERNKIKEAIKKISSNSTHTNIKKVLRDSEKKWVSKDTLKLTQTILEAVNLIISLWEITKETKSWLIIDLDNIALTLN